MAADDSSIGARTLRGIYWAYGSFVLGRGLTLVSTAILARLLEPRDFGLVALALVFTALLETVADLGIAQALVITREDEVEDRATTVFAATVGLGALLAAVVAALGPAMAAFFDEPDLAWLMGLLGLNFLLRALGATHYALAEKRLDFRSRTQAEVLDVLVRGLASIALAVAGLGAGAIVLGYLAGTAVLSAALWVLVPWRPRRRPRRAHLRGLVRFGVTYSAVDVLAAASSHVDDLFVGRVLGPAALGLYSIGFRLPELVVVNLSLVAGRVLFPAFAAVERERLPAAFLLAFRYTMLFAVPLAAGLAALAEPVILALFGERWEGSVDVMRVLALEALLLTMNIPAGTVYKSTGRPGVLLLIGGPRLVVLVAALTLLVDEGIVAAAACQAVSAAVMAVVATLLAVRLLGVGWRPLLAELPGPLLAAAAAGAVMAGVASSLSPWPALLAGIPAGAVLYIGILRLIRPDAVEDVRRRLLPSGAHHPAKS